ncbi:Uncharacterised protein [Staphylococcus aureus]|nr:hypothetical protein CSB83_1464 [Staphylococcus aureus]CAC6507176.1 Uncharacterised protein [Staphylococcus aureus]SBD35313.1 Uncharacterised protein [Staphylococcus aureus]SBD75749.1 Uncharacterised protein [Staphylococcus aureus]SBE15580.1 Uncharacterised protein [Staphylococcus aureus]
MLTLIKLKEDEQVIIYEYIPEDDISNGKGSVTFNKKRCRGYRFLII